MTYHDIRFPGESEEYRAARDELLHEEIELRSRIEEIGKLRQALPLGGTVPKDYVFEELAADGNEQAVRLSDLFRPGKPTLLVYSYMYSAGMKEPCAACTSIIDGFNGCAPHVLDRTNLVIVAKSPIERIQAMATSRGWTQLRLLSSEGNSYNQDYHAENSQGKQLPALNVFTRKGGQIRHFYATELLYADLDGHPRHVDLVWPIWNLFDMTPEGRGTSWHPRLTY